MPGFNEAAGGRIEGGKKFDAADLERRLDASLAKSLANASHPDRIEKRHKALKGLLPRLPAIGQHIADTCRDAMKAQGLETLGPISAYLVGGRTAVSQSIDQSTDFDIVLVSENLPQWAEDEETGRKVALADIEVKGAASSYHSYGERHLIETSGVSGLKELRAFRSSPRNAGAILLYSENDS